MAKETLVKKNIILWPDKSKKIFTKLNPDVATASSFEEAAKMIETKKPVLATMPVIEGGFSVADLLADVDSPKVAVNSDSPAPPPARTYSVMKIVPATEVADTTFSEAKWWTKPLYLYVVWPVCGAAAGILISMLMNFAYRELFAR